MKKRGEVSKMCMIPGIFVITHPNKKFQDQLGTSAYMAH